VGITPVGTTGRYSIARTSIPIAPGPSAAIIPRHHRYHGSPIPRLRPPRGRNPPPPPPSRPRGRRRRRRRRDCRCRRRDRPAAQDTRGRTRGADLDVSRTFKVSAACKATTLHDVVAPCDLAIHADLSAGRWNET